MAKAPRCEGDSRSQQCYSPMVSSVAYSVKALGGSSWTWDVKVDGCVVASGIATTETSARVSAIRAADEVNKRRESSGPDRS
jgi:hypothetical protein